MYIIHILEWGGVRRRPRSRGTPTDDDSGCEKNKGKRWKKSRRAPRLRRPMDSPRTQPGPVQIRECPSVCSLGGGGAEIAISAKMLNFHEFLGFSRKEYKFHEEIWNSMKFLFSAEKLISRVPCRKYCNTNGML